LIVCGGTDQEPRRRRAKPESSEIPRKLTGPFSVGSDRPDTQPWTYLLAAAASLLALLAGHYAAAGPEWLNAQFSEAVPLYLIALVAGVLCLVAVFSRPEAGLLILVALLYTNASELVVREFGLPSPLQLITIATAAAAAARLLSSDRDRRLQLHPIPLALYAAVIFMSSLGAADVGRANESLSEHVKGMLIFLIVTNLVTSRVTLERVVWVLLLSGAFLATISVYQVVSNSYGQEFGGFGRVELELVGGSRQPRVTGSLSDPNFYAQILVPLVPLALYRLWDETSPVRKLAASYALAVGILAVVFTYSRGAAIACALVLLAAALLTKAKIKYFLPALLALAPLALFVPQSFENRLASLSQLTAALQDTPLDSEDSSFRERRRLMAVAWEMFSDRPLLGVGAGNYPEQFDAYAGRIGTTLRSYDNLGERRPHSLYLEILAETGLAGLLSFIAIIAVALLSLWSTYRSVSDASERRSTYMIASLALALTAYLVTSLFLHGDYIRYLWLLLAIGAAATQVLPRAAIRPPIALAGSASATCPAPSAETAPVAPESRMASPGGPPVAYIMSRFPMLTETFILREMLELERQGVPLEVFPLLRQRAPVRHAEIEQLAAEIHYTPFVSPGIISANLRFLLRGPGRYLRLFWSVLRGNWGSANLFVGALGIFPKSVYFARLVEEKGIVHVHAHFATHPALSALIISELTGVGFSFTAHAHDIFLHERMLAQKVEKAAFVVAISRLNKDHLLTRAPHVALDNIKVVHCGVELDKYGSRNGPQSGRRATSDGPFTAVCVASLQPYKGIKYLIRACAQVVRRMPEFRCMVIGEGPDRAELEALVVDLDLQETVQLLGSKPQHEVAALLGDADLFVQPSVVAPSGQMDGIPVALMEAMASRLPVVSTRVSAIPELVADGDNGLLVPPADSAALADAIVSLCNDPELRRRLGSRGRERVAAEFELRRNVAELRALFTKAAQDGGARGVRCTAHGQVPPEIADWVRDELLQAAGIGADVRFSRLGGGVDSQVYAVSGGDGEPPPGGVILKLHRPHRATGSAAIDAGRRHAQNEFRALSLLFDQFSRGSGGFAVPRPLSCNAERAALLMERCSGDKLQSVMRWARLRSGARASLPAWFAACGEWLAIFHQATGREGDPRLQCERIEREFLEDLDVCKQRGLSVGLAASAAERFKSGKDAAFAGLSLVGRHCDFAPYNVLVSPARITVIDFEGLGESVAYDDLCYFLCMVEATPPYHLSRAMIDALGEDYLSGYQRHAELDRGKLHFFMIAAMVRVMAHSPVLRDPATPLDALKRRQRLSFYTDWLGRRLD
jgi:glycosyltransferase involved in cell wall biosynthesis/Ser/Thr protein kinase RdoA (MazF antagonist)